MVGNEMLSVMWADMKKIIDLTISSVGRCKNYVFSIFITYCISCSIGIIMSHNGNDLALSYRDKIVGNAVKTDMVSINYQKGNNFLQNKLVI
jgi:hypothetical protein